MAGRPRQDGMKSFSLSDNETPAAKVKIPFMQRWRSAVAQATLAYDPSRDAAGKGMDAIRLGISVGNGKGSTKMDLHGSDLFTVMKTVEKCAREWGDVALGIEGAIKQSFTVFEEDGEKLVSFRLSNEKHARSITIPWADLSDWFEALANLDSKLRSRVDHVREGIVSGERAKIGKKKANGEPVTVDHSLIAKIVAIVEQEAIEEAEREAEREAAEAADNGTDDSADDSADNGTDADDSASDSTDDSGTDEGTDEDPADLTE